MNVSSIASSPSAAAPQTASTTPARAADGDYLKPNMQTSQTRDADGDYKLKSAASSAVATSSSNVQAALTSLKKGG